MRTDWELVLDAPVQHQLELMFEEAGITTDKKQSLKRVL